jgi:hypothetical protein
MFAGDNAAPSLATSQTKRRVAADFVDGFWIVADVASIARFFKPRIPNGIDFDAGSARDGAERSGGQTKSP